MTYAMRVPAAIVMPSVADDGGRASAARLVHALLERAQRLEVGVHAHERLDEPLRLLERPLDLLTADRLERAAELLVEPEQIGHVADAVLREPAAELAVVAPQLVGFALHVVRHRASGGRPAEARDEVLARPV